MYTLHYVLNSVALSYCTYRCMIYIPLHDIHTVAIFYIVHTLALFYRPLQHNTYCCIIKQPVAWRCIPLHYCILQTVAWLCIPLQYNTYRCIILQTVALYNRPLQHDIYRCILCCRFHRLETETSLVFGKSETQH